MGKESKRHQQIRARKNARRQAKKKTQQMPHGALSGRSDAWLLYDCRIASEWRNTAEISTLTIARKSPSGEVAMSCFLVDLACLGIKNAMSKRFPSKDHYQDFRAHLEERQPLEECDLELAAKILDEATRYARSLGFEPHRDARKALGILGDADPQNCPEPVPLGGEDGKPLFIAGPYDDAPRIIATLERSVGPGNFHFMAPAEGLLPPEAL